MHVDPTACVICPQPTGDPAAYACPDCTARLREQLAQIVEYADDAQDAADGRARYSRSTTGGGHPTGDRAPDTLRADAVDHATTAVTTWARHIAERVGIRPPRPAPISGPVCLTDCRHRSCRTIRARRLEHPAAAGARVIAAHLIRLRRWPEVDQAHPELLAAARTIVHVADAPETDRMLIGVCDCGRWLYARARAAIVRCQCGQSWDVAKSRDILRQALDDQVLTAAEIATLAARAGHKRERIRKLITVWGGRGALVRQGTRDGDPLYRVGDAMARIDRLPVPTVG